MEEALEAYTVKVMKGENATQEDLLFHLAIAKACGNSTINTIYADHHPGDLTNFTKYHVCDKNIAFIGIQEHRDIYEAIKKQDPQLAQRKNENTF